MIDSFLTGLIASAIVAIIYGVIFAQREDRIRQFLAKRKKSVIKKIYVKAFVGAARGRASVMDSAILTFMVLLVPFGIAAAFLVNANIMEQKTALLCKEAQDIKFKLHGEQQPNNESVQTKSEKLLKEIEQFESDTKLLILIFRSAAGFFLAAFLVGTLFWRPFVVMRRGFSYELDRFTLRIQGLASKTELSELAVAESQIVDEQTLRAFVEMAHRVASRHDIPQLIKTFDLWRGDPNNN